MSSMERSGEVLEAALARRFPAGAAWLVGEGQAVDERIARMVVEAAGAGCLPAVVAEWVDDEPVQMARWLALAAEEVVLRRYNLPRRLQPEFIAAVDAVGPATESVERSGLEWDDRLPGPLAALRPLAEDVAARDGALRVLAGSAAWGERAHAGGYHVSGGLIVVMEAGVPAMAEALAHELGHAIDPSRGDVSMAGVERERFAHAVQALILARRPSSVAAAWSIIDRGEQARSGLRNGHPPCLPVWWQSPSWWPALFGSAS